MFSFNIHPFLLRLTASFVISASVLAAGIYGFLKAANESEIFNDSNILTEEDILWGPAFGQQTMIYKLKRSVYVKPDLLILGSSRVTQFREAMAPGVRFYNASLAATTFPEAFDFLTALYRKHQPKIVILGIDPWWFNPARTDSQPIDVALSFNVKQLLSATFSSIFQPRALKPIFSSQLETKSDVLGGRRPVGYMAAKSATGFRPDGSHQQGDAILGTNDFFQLVGMGRKYGFKYYINAAKSNEDRFQFVGTPAKVHAETLREIIKLNRSHGVETILFLPPLAHAVYQTVQDNPAQQTYFKRFEEIVRKAARESGVAFFNFHDLARLGISDKHALDGIHIDEIAALAIMRHMIENNKFLGEMFKNEARSEMARLATEKNSWVDENRLKK